MQDVQKVCSYREKIPKLSIMKTKIILNILVTKPKASKFDKVVRREVCQISTKGSRVFNFLDTVEASSSNSVYLLSIVEKNIPREHILAYGVCFIDTSIGEFYLGQFEDDQCNSKLLTLFAHFPPAHIIYERGNLSSSTLKLIDNFLPGIWKEALPKDTQFWSSAKVIQVTLRII